MPFEIALYVAHELVGALHYAHTRPGPDGRPLNLVHRDVTPQNVMLSYEGSVKLIDFGVALGYDRDKALDAGAVLLEEKRGWQVRGEVV